MIEWLGHALELLVATINIENPLGLGAIVLLTIMADIGIPIPFALDTILFVTVAKTGLFSLPVLLIISMLMVGRFIGGSGIYLLSRILGVKITSWMSKRFSMFQHHLDEIKSKSGRWLVIAMVIGRLTPGLMQFTTVATGALKIRYRLFALSVLITSMIYDGILTTMGYLTRIGVKDISPEMSVFAVLGFLVIMIIALVVMSILRNKKYKSR
ncbi:MAG: VTT domain-containing protein [Dehalococcoidales bacterium]|nr:VTT domain-containing protein [Dehalococcoidales bacterium]